MIFHSVRKRKMLLRGFYNLATRVMKLGTIAECWPSKAARLDLIEILATSARLARKAVRPIIDQSGLEKLNHRSGL